MVRTQKIYVMSVYVKLGLICLFANLSYAQTGETLFDDTEMHEIRIDAPGDDFYNTLASNHESYLHAGADKVYEKAELTIDDFVLPDSVGVRFKGETSFTEVFTEKKPIKIDINRFADDQKYEDLKKFNLHNARADASMVREKICYDLLRKGGSNAPRVSFAKVYINDVYWGVYSIVEQIDKTYLKENFDNKDGNLYKSSSGGSINMETIGAENK